MVSRLSIACFVLPVAQAARDARTNAIAGSRTGDGAAKDTSEASDNGTSELPAMPSSDTYRFGATIDSTATRLVAGAKREPPSSFGEKTVASRPKCPQPPTAIRSRQPSQDDFATDLALHRLRLAASPPRLVRSGSGDARHPRLGQFGGQKLCRLQAEHRRHAVDAARPHVLGAPLTTLVPLQICVEQPSAPG